MSRFDELKAKTDAGIIQVIRHALDGGTYAALEAFQSVDDPALLDAHRRTAKRACAEAARLTALLGASDTVERGEMNAKLELLRGMLDALSGIGLTPAPSEHTIANLARVFWEVRGRPEGLPDEDWYRAEKALKPKQRKEPIAACVGS